MVHKTSHRGVHSGNTLRAFNSRYSRRYHNQACIVSRVHPELLKELFNGKTDEKKAEPQNLAVDVALSLNKQSRWLLPSALIRQIESSDVSQSGLTVSLLERHKLKRPASCVSFHSNGGDVRRIQPRNGRYFSFNFPRVDGKSRRAIRREKQEELREHLTRNDKPDKSVGKQIEVFTQQGRSKKMLDLGESEVRYEVFYPSPSRSSISHNPKYIKQNVLSAPGDDYDDLVQHGKPKKQHSGKQRKRMSLKDLDVCDLPSYDTYFDRELIAVGETADNDDPPSEPTADDNRLEQKTTECLLRTLIDKAERLQHLMGMDKSRRRKKSGSKTCNDSTEKKSHIVFLPESKTDAAKEDAAEDTEEFVSLSQPVSSVPTDCTRVLLPTDDVTVSSLKDCFGKNYFETACKPRKFVLDITVNVREVLKKRGVQKKVAGSTDDALSYLIFVHDGFYSDEYDVYKVFLNTKLHQGLQAVQINTDDDQDLYRGTVITVISQTMDFVEGMVSSLQELNHFQAFSSETGLKSEGRQLKKHLGTADAYTPSVNQVFQFGSSLSEIVMPSLSDMLDDDPAFCDVCYEDVSPLTQGSAAATALLKCGHRVCDSCWAQHIHGCLHQGIVRVTCPGYDCQQEADVGVLLSVTALDTVMKLLQRREEVRISASETEKWCPNQSCGRVLHLQPSLSSGKPELQQDVVCVCGAHVCFQCMSPAHWPASCEQAEEYRTDLASAVFPNRQAEVHEDRPQDEADKYNHEQQKIMTIEGKHCPRCSIFISKDAGCPQMICRCGQLFCWYCAKPGYSHADYRGCYGCINVEGEKKLTTSIVVRHLDSNPSQEQVKEQEQKTSANRRQRVSLMERAFEHRQGRVSSQQHVHAITTLAKSVGTAAAKDKTLAQHIINVCSSSSSTSSDSTRTTTPSAPSSTSPRASSVLDFVTSFLKSTARSKQELHEVVEYSLVLLKDLPDSLLRRRALRISEDLGAFCSFIQSIFDAWNTNSSPGRGHLQEAVKAVIRLAEIQGWIHSALATHVVTVRKLRKATSI